LDTQGAAQKSAAPFCRLFQGNGGNLTSPLIGITTSRIYNRFGFSQIAVTEAYVKAVSRAGATPLLIPLGLPDTAYPALLEHLDGVLFTGGGDVQPERYGGQPHPLVSEMDPDRDRVEISLLQDSLQNSKPFLGICRGLQLINVAMGGSLYEDLQAQNPQAHRHQFFPEKPRSFPAHEVQIKPESRLAGILGATQTEVNSFHHQGIRQLAAGLSASAYAPDGVIEAFELPDYPFGLAVQWHPEWMQDQDRMQALFKAFNQAALQAQGNSR
jgi:putative glutamine amidotransferase